MKLINWFHQLFFNTTLEPEQTVSSVYGMHTPDKRPKVDTSGPEYLLGSKKIALHAPTTLTLDNPAYRRIIEANRQRVK